MRRQFSDLQRGSIELFCLAAEAVSRSMLFARTTRSVKLTVSGRRYSVKNQNNS